MPIVVTVGNDRYIVCIVLKYLFYLRSQVNGGTGEGYIYDEVILRTQRLAVGLQNIGVQQGDVICIFAPNNLD